jgi:Dipeptidyl peptidase IV (DPP IV) N-terminal region
VIACRATIYPGASRPCVTGTLIRISLNALIVFFLFVSEEELLGGGGGTAWPSVDGVRLLFAAFNCSAVRLMQMPWMGSGAAASTHNHLPFPASKTLRYPTVSLYLYMY